MADMGLLLTIVDLLDDNNISFSPQLTMHHALLLTILRSERIKIPNYIPDIVRNYLIGDFKKLFRMSPDTYEYLCKIMAPFPELREPEIQRGRQPVPLDKKVLVTLWYLGSQDNSKQISDRFNITESCVLKCIDHVLNAVSIQLRKMLVKWPNYVEQNEISDFFYGRNGFPGIIGAKDGTHIEIQAPPRPDKQTFVNRKGYYSMNVQGVCREDMRFTHVYVGWPGSAHDSRVLRNSDLWDNALNLCGEKHLLGDGGYPSRRWLVTPYRNDGNLTRAHTRFNMLLSSNRAIVERAFGRVKGRFSRLMFLNSKSMTKIIKTIMSCFVLHNMCVMTKDELDDLSNVDDGINANLGQQIIAHMEDEAAGFLKRDNLRRALFGE